MLIDAHAHLNFEAFKEDSSTVIKKCLENNIWIINIGSNLLTSKIAVEIAQNHSQGVFATIGLHPINLNTGLLKMKNDELEGEHFEKEFDYEKYRELAHSTSSGQAKSKVVAIGEIGLDYYWKPKTTKKKELFKQKQKELFLKESDLAKELNLPIIFHCRMAHQDLIEVLKSKFQNPNFKIKGEMHGFFGT